MTVVIAICSLTLLVCLISWFKVNSFISFFIVAIFAGLTMKMGTMRTFSSIEKGIGNTLGSITVIVVLGAMLGKIIADSGVVETILQAMLKWLGVNNMRLAFMITGFIVGLPLFYSVGFILLAPLVLTMASKASIPPIYRGLPMLASLSVTQGYLPPHPGPMFLVNELHADLGLTMFYGVLISAPAILISGLLFSSFTKKVITVPNPDFIVTTNEDSKYPGILISILTILSPVILISTGIIFTGLLESENIVRPLFLFLKEPTGSLLISLLFVCYIHGIRNGQSIAIISSRLALSVKDIANLLLIFAGAGALKQVLIEGGINSAISSVMAATQLNPLISGWCMAAIIRVCIGSSTIAGITTAGFILPFISSSTNVNLMVLSIGSGSMMFSHINDTGFWLFREYFQSSLLDTLKTWSIMETIISIIGLLLVLCLDSILVLYF